MPGNNGSNPLCEGELDVLLPHVQSVIRNCGEIDSFDLAELVHSHFPTASANERKKIFLQIKAAISQPPDDASSLDPSSTNPMTELPADLEAQLLGTPSLHMNSVLTATAASAVKVLDIAELTPKPASPNASPVKSSRQTTEVSEQSAGVEPFVFNSERCSDRNPVMPSRPRGPPGADVRDGSLLSFSGLKHEIKLSPAWCKYDAAEKWLEQKQFGNVWESAVSDFEAASALFVSEQDYVMAANCLVRAADCRRCLFNTDSVASLLTSAAELYFSGPRGVWPAAISAMKMAVFVARSAGRNIKAAKLCRKAAEICVACREPSTGVDFLHHAKDMYIDAGMTGEARACLARSVSVAVMDGSDPASAIDTLEKLADISIPEEQPLVLFRAMIMRLACIPGRVGNDTNDAISDCVAVLDQYTDLCVPLCKGKENEFLKETLRGIEDHEPQRIENAIQKYVDCHSLEEWVEPLMRLVWKNAVKRLASHLERMRAP